MPAERIARWFRIVAIAEACSWTGLLVGMLLKHVTHTTEVGVEVFGPIHGAMFVAYVATVLVAAARLRWSVGVTLVALAAAVPPFTSVAFEHWVRHRSRATPG